MQNIILYCTFYISHFQHWRCWSMSCIEASRCSRRGRGPAWTRQRWRGGPRLRLRLQRRMHFGALLNWADPAPSPRPIALQNTSLYLLKAEKKYITKHINGQINITLPDNIVTHTLKMTAQRMKTLLSEQTSRLTKCV